ncbi:hypothetical protein [Chryseolinea lacunae]|uniref:Uncharacterized protein n=1 Tax=Chryseolinea lacunae TaxID=2801331 RepID=A0ABS1KTN2_9BACT|nr:hypothetical protein [Chryseolinea lacunae]MBL0742744.1 hypothetical protein [Chryseolinea lacunae]
MHTTEPIGPLPPPKARVPSSILLFDTLQVPEFVALFKVKERRVYDLPNDTTLVPIWNTSGVKHARWIVVNDSVKAGPLQGYPMSFREMKGGIKRFTVVSEHENIIYLTAYTLDKFFNIVDTEHLTYQGGDVDVAEGANGKFVNDSTYLRTEITTEYDIVGDDPPDVSTHKVKLLFHANGQIEVKAHF